MTTQHDIRSRSRISTSQHPERGPATIGSRHPAAPRRATARALAAALALALCSEGAAAGPETDRLSERAAAAMHRAAEFLREDVAVEGSYLWRYSADLSYRKGEADATPYQGWAQPPGTPAIGMAYLQGYAATGDPYLLEGAIDAAHALAATQLRSGGWYYSMEFDPEARKAWCYRVDPDGCRDRDNRYRNSSTLDDNTTQSALRLLMLVDRILDEQDPVIHEAVTYGLEQFVEAQYPNGAWPVASRRAVSDEDAPDVGPARYPESWPREFVEPGRPIYVLNDNAMRDMIRTFLLAHRLYGDEAYKTAAIRAGDFLLAAQMPAPQSGWAQSYNAAMEPNWGRKFEPPAVAALESVGVIEALLDLYLYTGEQRYLDAVDAAFAWLDASRLPEGDWARFYELQTNRPLYMTRDDDEYEITYEDDDLPSHYTFRGRFDVEKVRQIYRDIKNQGRIAYLAGLADADGWDRPAAPDEERSVEAIIEALDEQGRWVDDGMIDSMTVVRNFEELARYVAAQDANGRTPAQAIAAVADPLGTGLHAEVFGLVDPSLAANDVLGSG